MKKSILLVLAILGAVSLMDCKKDNSTTTPNYYLQATINGQNFNATCTLSPYGPYLYFLAENKSPKNGVDIQMGIVPYVGVGTYVLTGNQDSNFAFVDTSGITYLPHNVSGYITITATKPNLTGNFNFTVDDSIKVTNGTFVAKAP